MTNDANRNFILRKQKNSIALLHPLKSCQFPLWRISRNWPVSVPTRVESRMRLELDRSFGRIIDWKLKQHPSFGRVVLPCAARTRRLVVDSPTVRGRRRGDSCLATDWPRSMRVALRLTLLRASSCRDRARGWD